MRSACLYACLSVCMSASIPQFSRNFPCMLPVAVARSSSDDNAIRYVLPVLFNVVNYVNAERCHEAPIRCDRCCCMRPATLWRVTGVDPSLKMFDNTDVCSAGGGSVVYWLWRWTRNSMVASSIPGRRGCGDALRLESKGRYGSFHTRINVLVTGKTVISFVNIPLRLRDEQLIKYMTGRYLDILHTGEFPFQVSLTLWNIIFLIGRLEIGEFGPVGKRATGINEASKTPAAVCYPPILQPNLLNFAVKVAACHIKALYKSTVTIRCVGLCDVRRAPALCRCRVDEALPDHQRTVAR